MKRALYDSIVSFLSENEIFARSFNDTFFQGEDQIEAEELEDPDDFRIRRFKRRFGSIPTVTKVYRNQLLRICVVSDIWEEKEVRRISRDAMTVIIIINGMDYSQS